MTLGRLLLVLFYLMLVAGGWLVGHWLTGFALIEVRPSNEPEIHRIVMLATGVYIAASAIPFVPGAEIGFALILALGDRIVFLVYIAMVTALLLAFLVGRFLPSKAIAGAFRFVGFERARNLVLRLEPLDSQARVAMLACPRSAPLGHFDVIA
ncbi:hypothetical protein [Minwuia thermotolerans]|uniref:TVP38/TMEM64 family membrane protein n=1 Tax=Minwuia thermotolerans TaxID=2056226 RepID=A0A2M9FX30_9PROT|nr:hypothetical protein [Minwuia thermotolerans]PJK28016.1 hypothetical protein CVT23_19195 [Minwuia thermotolerans]